MRDTVIALAKKQLMKWLVSKVPLLGVGFLNTIASMFLGKIIEKIVDVTILGYKFKVIDGKVNEQVNSINEKSKKDNLTDEEINELEKDILDLISIK